MSIVTEPTSRAAMLQVMALTTGLPMFGFGAIADVAILAIGGMLLTLIGALMWARRRDVEPASPPTIADRRWWRHPVNIPASIASGVGINVAFALLWWLGSR